MEKEAAVLRKLEAILDWNLQIRIYKIVIPIEGARTVKKCGEKCHLPRRSKIRGEN
jgi:hypothetical protein